MRNRREEEDTSINRFKTPTLLDLKGFKKDCLKTVLDMYKKANAGHIGSSLSCLDLLIYLHFMRMKPVDKFILSKGHAAAVLYSVLARSGKIKQSELENFYKDGTLFAAHPPCGINKINGITFGTGSLGHGLSLAAGIALSSKYSGKNFDVYCVLSDGDMNEGSTWEALLFAAHHGLSNLIILIDCNGFQGFGKCSTVLEVEPLAAKLKSFNVEPVCLRNGNDFKDIDWAFRKMDKERHDGPVAFVAHTTKGSGISFMENKLEWHYLSMTDEQYQLALKEIEDKYA